MLIVLNGVLQRRAASLPGHNSPYTKTRKSTRPTAPLSPSLPVGLCESVSCLECTQHIARTDWLAHLADPQLPTGRAEHLNVGTLRTCSIHQGQRAIQCATHMVRSGLHSRCLYPGQDINTAPHRRSPKPNLRLNVSVMRSLLHISTHCSSILARFRTCACE